MSNQHEHDTVSQRPTGPDELLTISEVAEILRVPVATLRYWRHLSTGPDSFKIGRGVRYWRSTVESWLHDQCNAKPPVTPKAAAAIRATP